VVARRGRRRLAVAPDFRLGRILLSEALSESRAFVVYSEVGIISWAGSIPLLAIVADGARQVAPHPTLNTYSTPFASRNPDHA
jgi:hypothetical protein